MTAFNSVNLAVALLPDREMSQGIQKMQESLAELGVSFLLNNQAAAHLTVLAGTINDQSKFIESLETVLKQQYVIKLFSIGFGVFVSPFPVIYLRWQLSFELIKLRKKLCDELFDKMTQQDIYTTDEFWVPKTSIAAQDTNLESLPTYLKAAQCQRLPSSTLFSHIALIDYTGESEKIVQLFTLCAES